MDASDAGDPSRRLVFQRAVFSLTSVKKAAYRCIAQMHVEIELVEDAILCTLHPVSQCDKEQLDTLESVFRREVLDQDLRESIYSETTAYRNAILALAFAPSDLAK